MVESLILDSVMDLDMMDCQGADLDTEAGNIDNVDGNVAHNVETMGSTDWNVHDNARFIDNTDYADWNITEDNDLATSTVIMSNLPENWIKSGQDYTTTLQINNYLYSIKVKQDVIWDYITFIKITKDTTELKPWFPVIATQMGYQLHGCNNWVFSNLNEYIKGLKLYLEYQSILNNP